MVNLFVTYESKMKINFVLTGLVKWANNCVAFFNKAELSVVIFVNDLTTLTTFNGFNEFR